MKLKRSDFLGVIPPDKYYYCSCYNTEDDILVADVKQPDICSDEHSCHFNVQKKAT